MGSSVNAQEQREARDQKPHGVLLVVAAGRQYRSKCKQCRQEDTTFAGAGSARHNNG